MIIIFLVILFHIFTTVNTISPLFDVNKRCGCYATSLDDIDIYYKENVDIEFTASVKSWDNLEIFCKSSNGSLTDIKRPSQQLGKKIKKLAFRNCILTEKTRLKEFVKRLGIEESETFSFQTYSKRNIFLTREHLQGISNVEILILSQNSLSNISRDLFVDFPNLKDLDISSNNLILPDKVFDATPKLKRLNLNRNKLILIDSTLFDNLKNLEFLDLSQNRMEVLEDGVFYQLSRLRVLNLASNKLKQMSPSTFRKLKKLKKLDISDNHFLHIPSNLFDRNKALRHIVFSANQVTLSTLPEYLLSNLIQLNEVNLNRNGFRKLPGPLFWYSRALKTIYLNGNQLTILPKTIFRGLRNLEKLSLTRNWIRTLPTQVFKDLDNLKYLDMSENSMDFIPNGLFNGLTSLRILNMEKNHLTHIEYSALFTLKELRTIKLSNNKLKFWYTGKKLSPFVYNTKLNELYLSHNRIEHLFEDWTIYRDELTVLNLSHNNITTISAKAFHFPSNKILVDLSYNYIRNILLDGIEETTAHQLQKRDVILIVNNNPILCDCNLYDLIRLFNNKMPIPVYNYFEIISDGLMCVHKNGTLGPKIEELNSVTYICPEDDYFKMETKCQIGCTCGVRSNDKTRVLDCSYQNMSTFEIDKDRVNFAANYPIILNLTGNALTKIPSVESLKPINVTGLLLSNNRINAITLNNLPKSLMALELHNNNISRIDDYLFKYLNSSSLKELTLSGNPILCDCNSQELYSFVQSRRFTFQDLKNVKCHNFDQYLYNMTVEQLCKIDPLL
ncbi:hypothetical protein M0802_011857 [Mischocyttarus mexicanus]|nr:hypothetical protein M0802_011857 [Mischocyttarus mexicanus]